MINRRFLMAKLGSCSLLAMNAMFFSGSLAWAVPSAIEAFDKDDDGTLDLAEVKEAAGKMFDKLDKDGDRLERGRPPPQQCRLQGSRCRS
jgi:hypothetical protein